ncbi:MAG TPA: hypothetical protein VJV74_13170 [Terriglobia bacterium]|nr:hypothetical protein [Terriglobia bacterium]
MLAVINRPARKLVQEISPQQPIDFQAGSQRGDRQFAARPPGYQPPTDGMFSAVQNDNKPLAIPGGADVRSGVQKKSAPPAGRFDLDNQQAILFVEPHLMRGRDAAAGPEHKREC